MEIVSAHAKGQRIAESAARPNEIDLAALNNAVAAGDAVYRKHIAEVAASMEQAKKGGRKKLIIWGCVAAAVVVLLIVLVVIGS